MADHLFHDVAAFSLFHTLYLCPRQNDSVGLVYIFCYNGIIYFITEIVNDYKFNTKYHGNI